MQEIERARERLRNISISREQVAYLCTQASRGHCEGHNGEIAAARIAIASAARRGGRVRSDDLRLAVKMAITPRSVMIEENEEELGEEGEEEERREEKVIEEERVSNTDQTTSYENTVRRSEEEEKEIVQEQNQKEEETEREREKEKERELPEQLPGNIIFQGSQIAIKGSLTKFLGKQKVGIGRRSGRIYSRERGRYVRPVIPKKGESIRIALDATLREAAKHQIWRRKEAEEQGKDPKKVYVLPEDIRAKLMARKAGSVLIFVVDASGSMALNRMDAAKGAAYSLLGQAYQNRDKIALISFHGQYAELLLPPTRSVVLAKRRLEDMGCGGGTPLAHALTIAVRTGLSTITAGNAGRCIIILISDGRTNVPLSTSLRHIDTIAQQTDDMFTSIQENSQKVEETRSSSADAIGERNTEIISNETETKSDEIKSLILDDALSTEKRLKKSEMRAEVINIGRQISFYSKLNLLVIDTENRLFGTGIGLCSELAKTAKGKYFFVPKLSAKEMKFLSSIAITDLNAL